MAARLNPKHDQATREKIQTSQLINRLQGHVDTHPSDEDYKKKFMEKSQVTAALGLLKKTLPDLSNVEQSIDPQSIDAIGEILKLVRNNTRGIPGDR